MEDTVEIKDVYFRRFLVPIVIALLIIAGVACIIADSPGTKPEWNTYGTVFGGQVAGALGALKKLHKVRG
jgi:hypothetical protein